MGTTESSPNAVQQQKNPDQKTKNLNDKSLFQKISNLNKIQNEQPKSVSKQKTDLLDKRDEYLLLGRSDYFNKSKCAKCRMMNTFICEHDTVYRDEIHNSFAKDGSYHISPRKPIENGIDYKMYLNSAKSKNRENKNVKD
jgi:hypothetical protein